MLFSVASLHFCLPCLAVAAGGAAATAVQGQGHARMEVGEWKVSGQTQKCIGLRVREFVGLGCDAGEVGQGNGGQLLVAGRVVQKPVAGMCR